MLRVVVGIELTAVATILESALVFAVAAAIAAVVVA
jgi:hypothetical protein